ncbi:MAG: PAS domain S-box protein [Terriglobales bacterium]|jgi:PAS domain S-box-containing protein
MPSHPGERKHHFPEASVAWDPIRRALEEDEDWYRDLVEHSQDLLCVHDLEGRFLSVNPVPARLLGYSVEEMLHKPMRDFVDPQFRAQFDDYLREIKATGESQGLLAVRTRSGEQRIWEYHNTLRTTGVNTPIVRGMAHDVTARVGAEKALRESNEELQKAARERARNVRELTLFRTLLDQSSDDIKVLDPETFRILDVNARACLVLGYSREELLSMTLRDIDTNFDKEMFDRTLQQLRASGFAVLERIHHRKDGTEFPVETNIRLVRLDREYAVTISRDITDRKRAEEALRTTNQQLLETAGQREQMLQEHKMFRTLLDQSNDGIEVLDPVTLGFIDVNERTCKELGYGREELLSMTVFDIDPVYKASYHAHFLLALRESGSAVFESVHRRKDGTTFPVEVNVRVTQQNREYFVAIVRNITERKRAEERLREFERVVENLEDMILVVNRDYRYVLVNRAFLRYWGVTEEQVVGNVLAEVMNPKNPKMFETAVKARLDECFRGNVVTYETKTTYPGMGEREVSITCLPVEGPAGIDRVACVLRDITDRKRAEMALRESEARERAKVKELETLLDALPISVLIAQDAECRQITANRMGREHLRLQPGANASMSASAGERPRLRFLRDGVEITADQLPMQRAAATGRPVYDVPTTMVFEDGMQRHEISNAMPLLDEDGRVRGAIGAAMDITAQKRAEEGMRASEERMRLAQELARIGTFERNLLTGESLWSREMEAIYGLAPGEYPRSVDTFLELVHAEDRPAVTRLIAQSMQSGAAVGEYRVLWPDGTVHWIASRWRVYQDENGRPARALGIDFDITARKQAEEILRANEARFRLFVEQAPAGLAMFDREMRYLHVSHRWRTDLGLGDRDLLGVSHYDVFPGLPEHWKEAHRRGLAGEVVGEESERFCRADGTVRWIRWEVQPWHDQTGGIGGTVIFSEDITARKRAEEAIATLVQVRCDSSQSFFASMACQLAKCLDADYVLIGELIEGKQQKIKTVGACCKGQIADSISYDLAETPCKEIIEQGPRVYASGVRGTFPKDPLLQKMRVESLAGTPLRDSRDRTLGVMVAAYTRPLENTKMAEMILQLFSTRTAAEIERKRTEEALRQSDERFRVALKNSPITVFNQDRDLRYTWIYNPPFSHATGLPLGKTSVEWFGAEGGKEITEIGRRVLDTGIGIRSEVKIAEEGKQHYFDTTIEPVLDTTGAVIGLTGAGTDITELREASEALRDAKKKLTEEKLYLEQEIDTELGFGEIVGRSKSLQTVMENVGKVAQSDATVLLLGETGSGKELVARAIHRLSQRSNNSFIKMNCAAIPSGLLESELFGNEKGAFSGAVSKKIGRLELADRGTLFLDEVGEISLALQPKLLRVLQDQEFERLGGVQTLKVDFRLIAATNRNLADQVRQKEFRSDLYYRMNVFPILVPPLRERRDDIPLLVEHFVQKCARRMKKTITSIPRKTMDALTGWDWPGNVRELENFIERSVILTHGSVLVAPLSGLKPMATEQSSAEDTLEAAEREHILRALRESRGQIGGVRGAAMRLGLKRTTLQSKLKQLGINPRTGRTEH